LYITWQDTRCRHANDVAETAFQSRKNGIVHPDFHYIPLSRENILAQKLRRDLV